MNFKEAKKAKIEIGEKFKSQEGYEMNVFITPENEKDFQNYSRRLKGITITDDLAKSYSSNDNYILRGVIEIALGTFLYEVIQN